MEKLEVTYGIAVPDYRLSEPAKKLLAELPGIQAAADRANRRDMMRYYIAMTVLGGIAGGLIGHLFG